MNYQFPEIYTINDVLPHIEGRDEFIVAEREGYTVINYRVDSTSDTFPPVKVNGGSAKMREARSLTNRILRECRGIIFDSNGKIISRPFHKFFNVGEREETLPRYIDITQPHVVMEKMDGSMIRPLAINGHLRLGTKMGVTEVAMQSEEWLAAQEYKYTDWLWRCVENNVTPLFEWTSPENQIVLTYNTPDLVLLACRHNNSGEYFMPNEDDDCPFNIVPQYGSVGSSLDSFVETARKRKGREGDIIRFDDGHMVKIKNDWYVRIHKILDQVRYDRNIVALIFKGELDDAIPPLPQEIADRIRAFESRFATCVQEVSTKYETYWKTIEATGMDRKTYAQTHMNTVKETDPFAVSYVFGRFVGRNSRDMILDHIEKNSSSNVKWDECAKWLGM